ncbi:MAG: DMT family transporter [Actinomycetota bacterium]|nr:DMT family transporter [Actinomycetota bacterium]
MVYAFAVAAAMVSATAGVTQRLGLESVPAESTMRIGLLTHAMRHSVWLLGFALLLGQFVLQAMALRFGQLSVVQPLLTLDLLFVVTILATVFHRRLRWREWAGAGAIVAGLAGFLLLASPSTGRGLPSGDAWAEVSSSAVVVAAVMVVATRWGPRWWKAAAFGAAAAILFAYNAALTKATTTLITRGWGHVFANWEPYAIALTGLAGFFLLQNALHAGPIASSRASMVVLNPIVSILIGATVFSEHLRDGGWYVTAEVVALTILCAGAFLLTQSPLVSAATIDGEHSERLGVPSPYRPQA